MWSCQHAIAILIDERDFTTDPTHRALSDDHIRTDVVRAVRQRTGVDLVVLTHLLSVVFVNVL